MEKWKDIVIKKNDVIHDYTGKYQVSNLGRIRSLNFNRSSEVKILKPSLSNTGYYTVGLCKDGKHEVFTIHRLVANAFIPNIDNLPLVNHKDENPLNNHVDNLEWCTVKYNINYGTARQRASEKIKGEKHFFYGKHHTEEAKHKQSEAKKGDKHPRAKKVMCIETGQLFGCIKDADKWCGITGGVGACVRGRSKTAGGYHWQYVMEEGETQS